MQVLFLPEVQGYYDKLEDILYEKGYFGFKESSKKYVQELVDDIKATLPIKPYKPAPLHFNRYGKGMYYATFKKSRHTHWYVFFRIYRQHDEVIYQVRYMTNNHVSAQLL